MIVPVPAWNTRGVIDPVNSSSPTSTDRAPYEVSLEEFVVAFALSRVRANILRGLLKYRAELHGLGLVGGFQWVDGSFLENIEMLESRDPGDVDVVTFFDMPVGQTQVSLKTARPDLFPTTAAERADLKRNFSVDGYNLVLGSSARRLIANATYWYSMWSHRRDLTWKGFVQIDLAPTEDASALSALEHLEKSFVAAPATPAPVPHASPTTGMP